MKHSYSVTFFYTRLLCIMLMLCARVSYGTTITSIASGDMSNTATWDCGCVPGSADSVIISALDTVNLTAPDTLQALTINLNGVLNSTSVLNLQEITPGGGTSLTVNGTYSGTSAGKTTWLINTNAAKTIIDGTGIVSTTGVFTINSGATIKAGANLSFTSTSTFSGITINGDTLHCFGTLTIAKGTIKVNAKTLQVESTGVITLTTGKITMGAGGNVYNYGSVTVGGNITGSGSGWYNYANSSLTLGGTFTSVYLYAFYPGNTVNYNGAGPQSMQYTALIGYEGYWNLKCSNSGLKSIDNSNSIFLYIYGDLTIQDNAQFHLNNTGGGGNDLYLYGNWINTSANADPFLESATVVTFQGSSAQSISSGVTGGESFVVANISGAGVTQNNCNVNVSAGLYLYSGLMNTGLYEVNVASALTTAITLVYSGSYINGNLRRSIDPAGGSYDFPVGNANAHELVKVNFTAANTVGNLLVNFSNPASSINGLPLADAGGYQYINVLNCGGIAQGTGNANDGVWSITPSVITSDPFDISLYGSNYDNSQAAHTVLKRTDASSPWTLPGTYQYSNLTNPIVATRTGLSGFSQFAIGGSINALPIELLSFEANNKDDKVDLSWTTATETNNDFFTVERYAPAVIHTSPLSAATKRDTARINFIPIGVVKGAGNSGVSSYYHLLDESPSPSERGGLRYYRLKQTDFDGKFTYSNIISIKQEASTQFIFNIYPNPGSGLFTIDTENLEPDAEIIISNMLGKVVYKNIIGQVNQTGINLSEQTKGFYFYQIVLPSSYGNAADTFVAKGKLVIN